MIFPYKWYLKNGYQQTHGLKVFSTFACGGGSTMGYKLAGFDVIGANDIDKQMAKVYKENHKPKHYYLCDIRELNKKIKNKEVHENLYNLDILDGSPPCSTFSIMGKREEGWNKEKVFREGQVKQRLDDLFFHFIETVRLLQPKVVIAENVKGLILGNAKGYVIQIKELMELAGYNIQIFCLNSATMGVPQKRERIFIIGSRKDLNFGKVEIKFAEKAIKFRDFEDKKGVRKKITANFFLKMLANPILPSGVLQIIDKKGKLSTTGFGFCCLPNCVPNTLVTKGQIAHYNKTHYLTTKEFLQIGSFPLDYNFLNIDFNYLIGMSVPPVMMAQIANQIYLQWFNKESVK